MGVVSEGLSDKFDVSNTAMFGRCGIVTPSPFGNDGIDKNEMVMNESSCTDHEQGMNEIATMHTTSLITPPKHHMHRAKA